MILNIATLFFLRETGGPGEKPSYLSPSDHQFSDVFFFDLFSFFLFSPLFSFFNYFLCPIFFIYFFHISFQKCQCCSLKLSISTILSCTAILWGFFVSGTAIFSFRQSGTACSVFPIVGTAAFFFSFEMPEHLLPDGLYI